MANHLKYLDFAGLTKFNETVNQRLYKRLKYMGELELNADTRVDWSDIAPCTIGHMYVLTGTQGDKVVIDDIEYSVGDTIYAINDVNGIDVPATTVKVNKISAGGKVFEYVDALPTDKIDEQKIYGIRENPVVNAGGRTTYSLTSLWRFDNGLLYRVDVGNRYSITLFDKLGDGYYYHGEHVLKTDPKGQIAIDNEGTAAAVATILPKTYEKCTYYVYDKEDDKWFQLNNENNIVYVDNLPTDDIDEWCIYGVRINPTVVGTDVVYEKCVYFIRNTENNTWVKLNDEENITYVTELPTEGNDQLIYGLRQGVIENPGANYALMNGWEYDNDTGMFIKDYQQYAHEEIEFAGASYTYNGEIVILKVEDNTGDLIINSAGSYAETITYVPRKFKSCSYHVYDAKDEMWLQFGNDPVIVVDELPEEYDKNQFFYLTKSMYDADDNLERKIGLFWYSEDEEKYIRVAKTDWALTAVDIGLFDEEEVGDDDDPVVDDTWSGDPNRPFDYTPGTPIKVGDTPADLDWLLGEAPPYFLDDGSFVSTSKASLGSGMYKLRTYADGSLGLGDYTQLSVSGHVQNSMILSYSFDGSQIVVMNDEKLSYSIGNVSTAVFPLQTNLVYEVGPNPHSSEPRFFIARPSGGSLTLVQVYPSKIRDPIVDKNSIMVPEKAINIGDYENDEIMQVYSNDRQYIDGVGYVAKLGGRYGTVHTGDSGYLSVYDTDHSDFAMRIINETLFKQSNGAINTVLALCTVDQYGNMITNVGHPTMYVNTIFHLKHNGKEVWLWNYFIGEKDQNGFPLEYWDADQGKMQEYGKTVCYLLKPTYKTVAEDEEEEDDTEHPEFPTVLDGVEPGDYYLRFKMEDKENPTTKPKYMFKAIAHPIEQEFILALQMID